MGRKLQDFEKYLRSVENLYLFGAGNRAERLCGFCRAGGIPLKGFIVTDKEGNPETLSKCPVYGLEEADRAIEGGLSGVDLVVAIRGDLSDLIFKLTEYGFHSIYGLPNPVYSELLDWYRWKEYESLPVMPDPERPFLETGMTTIRERESGKLLCRMELSEVRNDRETVEKECRREHLENLYGTFEIIPHKEYDGNAAHFLEESGTELYAVMSHLDQMSAEELERRGLIPLQVGAELTEYRKGCGTDNTGDHISAKNVDYSECTGLYWIWKNTRGQDYVGIDHYRRQMWLDEVSMAYIREQGIDIVLGYPHFTAKPLKEYFLFFIPERDWELMRQALFDQDASYLPIFEEYEKQHFFFSCNLGLFKREWFDRYCEFAFSVSDRIEKYYNDKHWIRRDRYMGFIFENLESLYLIRHKEQIKAAYTEVRWG